MAKTILQINFKFAGSKAEYLKAFGEVAATIAASPGLLWKVWPWNDQEQMGGGIYVFEDEASARDFLGGPIATGLGQNPVVTEISVMQFEVLDSLTAITRGPV